MSRIISEAKHSLLKDRHFGCLVVVNFVTFIEKQTIHHRLPGEPNPRFEIDFEKSSCEIWSVISWGFLPTFRFSNHPVAFCGGVAAISMMIPPKKSGALVGLDVPILLDLYKFLWRFKIKITEKTPHLLSLDTPKLQVGNN